jgi:predicted nucleic acid-binding protein
LKLYLDSSALVKRYVAEPESEAVFRAMEEAESWTSCRLAFVETARAVGLRAGPRGAIRFHDEWQDYFDIIELDRELSERAAGLAVATHLRALDAIHLAAALSIERQAVTFATWDLRLHRAARERGLRTLPRALG